MIVDVTYKPANVQAVLETDRRIRAILDQHCGKVEADSAGFGFGKRDVQFWVDGIDPDVDLEFALEDLLIPEAEILIMEDEELG